MFIFCFPLFILGAEGQIDSTFIQRHYEFSDFQGISAVGSLRIKVMKANEWDIRVFSSREDSRLYRIRYGDGTFYISFPDRSGSTDPTPVVVISMPDLYNIELKGPVQMEAGGFSSLSDLKVSLGENSYLNLNGFEATKVDFVLNNQSILHAFLSADDVDLRGSGSFSVRMGGRVNKLYLSSDSRSRFDGTMLLVDHGELHLSGKSEIRLTPQSSLIIYSTDEALIYYNDDFIKEAPVVEGPAILRKY